MADTSLIRPTARFSAEIIDMIGHQPLTAGAERDEAP
jgi:hypothetical protein